MKTLWLMVGYCFRKRSLNESSLLFSMSECMMTCFTRLLKQYHNHTTMFLVMAFCICLVLFVNGVAYGMGARYWTYTVSTIPGSPMAPWFQTVPAVNNDMIYTIAGSDDTMATGAVLFAFKDNGTSASIVWQYTLDTDWVISDMARHKNNIIVYNDVVYTGTGGSGVKGTIYAINATTGSKIWSASPNYIRCHYLSINSSANTLLAADGPYLKAYNASNGSLKWQRGPFGKEFILSVSSVYNNTVYIGADDYTLYAVNATTGTLNWSYTTGMEVKSTAVRVGDMVYFGSNDNKVYAVRDNGYSASLIWTYTTGGYVRSTAAVDNGVVYIGSFDRYMYALNASSGSMIWKFRAGRDVDTKALLDSGKVYFIANDGVVYCLDASNGNFLLEYKRYSSGSPISSEYHSNGLSLGSLGGVKRIYVNGGHWSDGIGSTWCTLYCLNLSIPSDSTGPTVTTSNQIVQPVAAGYDLPITCVATDNDSGVGVKRVVLTANGTDIECERRNRNNYWIGYVPGSMIAPGTPSITYSFTATDAAGNSSSTGSYTVSAAVKTALGAGWYGGDLHCHPEESNVDVVSTWLYNAKTNGCKWVNSTPHGSNCEQELSQHATSPDFIWMPGDEIPMRDSGHSSAHNLALNHTYTHNPDSNDFDWMTQVINAGGANFFAHNEYGSYSYNAADINSSLGTLWFGLGQMGYSYLYRMLNAGYKIFSVEGSDTRESPKPYTYVYVESLTKENIIDALKKGHNYSVSSGYYPCQMDFRVNDKMMGDTVSVSKGEKITLKITFQKSGTGSMPIYLIKDGKAVGSWTYTYGTSFYKEVEQTIDSPCWYLLMLTDDDLNGFSVYSYARSNPIWFAFKTDSSDIKDSGNTNKIGKMLKANEGGELLALTDTKTKLVVPANRFNEDRIYYIESVFNLPVSSKDPKNAIVAYDFTAENASTKESIKRLGGDVTIVLHTTLELIGAANKNNLTVGFWNGLYWVPLTSTTTIDGNDIYVQANTSHLTIYGIIEKYNQKELTVGPNPFTPLSSQYNLIYFNFNNENSEEVELKIWDLTGVMVKKITGSGVNSLNWDGKDEEGEVVEAGIYLYQLKVGSGIVGRNTIVVAK